MICYITCLFFVASFVISILLNKKSKKAFVHKNFFPENEKKNVNYKVFLFI